MNIISLFEGFTILSLVKILIVILLAVYSVFAFLMMTQVRSMTRAVSIKDDYVVRTLGVGHLTFAVLVLFIAVIVL